MEKYLIDLISEMFKEIAANVMHNRITLVIVILISAGMNVYVNMEKLRDAFLKRPAVSIWGSVIVGALTPLCACGTMGVVLGMLKTVLPWGPVMAFLTSSPLMSPEGFVMLTGIISFKFAAALTVASIAIGLYSGYITHFLEKRTGFLKDQSRMMKPLLRKEKVSADESGESDSCGCGSCDAALDAYSLKEEAPENDESCFGSSSGKTAENAMNFASLNTSMINAFDAFGRLMLKLRITEFLKSIVNIGVKQILFFFCLFVGIGFLITRFVPMDFISAYLGSGNPFGVVFAALAGLPLYIAGDSAVPLIKALINGGAGEGAMLAFMISGPATSAWVIAGISVFMRKKALILYVAYILAGAVISGYVWSVISPLFK